MGGTKQKSKKFLTHKTTCTHNTKTQHVYICRFVDLYTCLFLLRTCIYHWNIFAWRYICKCTHTNSNIRMCAHMLCFERVTAGPSHSWKCRPGHMGGSPSLCRSPCLPCRIQDASNKNYENQKGDPSRSLYKTPGISVPPTHSAYLQGAPCGTHWEYLNHFLKDQKKLAALCRWLCRSSRYLPRISVAANHNSHCNFWTWHLK